MLLQLQEVLGSFAPLVKEAFQIGASEEMLQTLEHHVGSELTDDFKALYRSSNGFRPDAIASLFYGIPFCSIEHIHTGYQSRETLGGGPVLRYADSGVKLDYTYSLKRVPIGDDNGTCLLCIDLDPDEDGQYGQVILVDHDMGVALKLADSISELIAKFIRDIEVGKYKLLEEALEDGVHWLSPSREIDVVNWYNSPTWAYVNEALK